MLLPITHDKIEARRWPILTTVFLVAMVLAHVVLAWTSEPTNAEYEGARVELVQFWDKHSDLEAPRALERVGVYSSAYVRGPESRAKPSADSIEPATEEDRGTFDALVARFVKAAEATPDRRFGYVPTEGRPTTLVTYLFVHGGALHLVANMWFLWLCACNLEDRWGRLVFLPMLLAGGVVAALVHGYVYPTSSAPLVGASGAIAGAMGAFFVTYARTKIRFVYVFFLFVRLAVGTFLAPAWLMLALWLGEQIVWAVSAPPGVSGVAYWAHVGGFVFGATFAAVMRISGLDARLDAAVEKKVTRQPEPEIQAATSLIDAGEPERAIARLEAFVAVHPSSIDAHLELARAAHLSGNVARGVAASARLVELYLASGLVSTAADVFVEVDGAGLAGQLPVRTRRELGARLALRDGPRAARVYESLYEQGVGDQAAAKTAIAYAHVLVGLDRLERAREVLRAVERSGQAKDEVAEAIVELWSQSDRSIAL